MCAADATLSSFTTTVVPCISMNDSDEEDDDVTAANANSNSTSNNNANKRRSGRFSRNIAFEGDGFDSVLDKINEVPSPSASTTDTNDATADDTDESKKNTTSPMAIPSASADTNSTGNNNQHQLPLRRGSAKNRHKERFKSMAKRRQAAEDRKLLIAQSYEDRHAIIFRCQVGVLVVVVVVVVTPPRIFLFVLFVPQAHCASATEPLLTLNEISLRVFF